MSSTIPRIIQLSQNVVDKIAAGEVVIRPVNAVKELVENSLDAGATEVNVSIRVGGLELIKIQVLKVEKPRASAFPKKKFSGLPREELAIACSRFTTSKLREFEDLQKIQTFGFRGEALASISLVSNLIITSRTANEICASKACYRVVIRPVNAVKELVENSLDAGATEINVSIRAGGLELIKIQDNGHGINREELSIACCRFTTSKLREFEDLQKIQTFGFRGEALASISLVSNLIITSRTANEICASKACYREGKLIGQIERSAGLLGTTICVEKLFQNMPSRLAAFRQPNEEAHRIADILIRYSIHYPKISFSYRRLDGNGYDFRTSGDGDQHSTIKRLLHEKASNVSFWGFLH
uniref:Uncharacterized protein n=1 Tax=Meloidogyne floridensis TaxID=298350 RepID=A0A915NL31_9BILA